MPELGQVLITDAVEAAMSSSQIQAVLKQLVEHADACNLGLGCIYHSQLSLGPDEYMAGIRNNPETDEYDAWIGELGDDCPWLGEPPPSATPQPTGLRTTAVAEPPSFEELEEHIADLMRGTKGDAAGVTPANVKVRLERIPPYRLQLLQGGKVTHELPLWSLGVVNALKSMLNYHPFCYDENDPGGMYEAGDKQWVVWSNDEEGRPKGGKVFRG